MRRTLALAQKTMGFTKTLIREGVSVACDGLPLVLGICDA